MLTENEVRARLGTLDERVDSFTQGLIVALTWVLDDPPPDETGPPVEPAPDKTTTTKK